MSVFTPLSAEQAAAWLENYAVGTLQTLAGIAEGVQNTNFFLDTTLGSYVLTIFEQAPGERIQVFWHRVHQSTHQVLLATQRTFLNYW